MKTINVTKNDISNGQRCGSTTCPTSLAIKRLLKPTCAAIVGIGTVSICKKKDEDDGFSITLPEKASDFILNFDKGKEVKPFKFKLDIPSKYLKK